MQQFTVPQFIDVENKIIGPLSTRQFMIMLSGAIIMGISYKLADLSLFITISLIDFALVVSFAFVKINGRPFHLFVLNLVQTWRRPNLRVWGKRAASEAEVNKKTLPTSLKAQPARPKIYRKSHLAELALIVDTKGKYKGEK